MSYSGSPQQPSPVMSMVKPEPLSHSPTGVPNHHRGAFQGDLISMYIPGGDTSDTSNQRAYPGVQQHYLGGTVPLTHIWSLGNAPWTLISWTLIGTVVPHIDCMDYWTLWLFTTSLLWMIWSCLLNLCRKFSRFSLLFSVFAAITFWPGVTSHDIKVKFACFSIPDSSTAILFVPK